MSDDLSGDMLAPSWPNLVLFCSLFLDLPLPAAQLATSAVHRLRQAFRPATQKTYSRMFRDFCGFLVATGLLSSQVTHVTLLVFMEFLLQNDITPSNIANYMAGLRASFVLYDMNTAPFQNHQLQCFHRAAKLQIQSFPKTKLNLDEFLLTRIITACDTLHFPFIFKPLYLLAFFSFLRISNILPHAITSFDPTRQLAVGDVIFSQNAAAIIIKWSKTLQDK